MIRHAEVFVGAAGGIGELQKMRLEIRVDVMDRGRRMGARRMDTRRRRTRGKYKKTEDAMRTKVVSATAVYGQVSIFRNENSSLARRENSNLGTRE